MHGFSGHAYKFIKPDGSFVFVHTHLLTDQGIKNFENDEAVKLAGEKPDFATHDLFNAIEKANFRHGRPFRYNIFDSTKIWPHSEFPMRRFGKLTLNKNPEKYFAESRLFSYKRHPPPRLGVIYLQIPVNCRLNAYNPFERDGVMRVDGNYGKSPNCQSFFAPMRSGHAQWRFFARGHGSRLRVDSWFVVRARENPGQQENFVYNAALHLSAANRQVQEQTFHMVSRVDRALGDRIRDRTTRTPKKHK
ncbi:catalase [Lipomyces kononenkoae]|uniref:Catalase n=1 Tax=Lipomyces kononenkoae TaxID=34357 RepID=A0ACC3T051_LIPKO